MAKMAEYPSQKPTILLSILIVNILSMIVAECVVILLCFVMEGYTYCIYSFGEIIYC